MVGLACLLAASLLSIVFWAGGHRLTARDYETQTVTVNTAHPVSSTDAGFVALTYNIGYASGLANNTAANPARETYESNLEAIAGVLRSSQADIAALQEVDFDCRRSHSIDQAAYVAERAAFPFCVRAYDWSARYVPFPYWPPRAQFGSMEAGQVVFTKYAVEPQKRIAFIKPQERNFLYRRFYPDRIVQVLELDVAGRDLVVFNVHLEAWQKGTRERQARAVADLARQYMDRPLLVAGDFNATFPWATRNPDILRYHASKDPAHERSVATLLEAGLKPAVSREAAGGGRENEFYSFRSAWPHITLDHLFYNDRLDCVEARVLQDTPPASDHYPVVATFRFRT